MIQTTLTVDRSSLVDRLTESLIDAVVGGRFPAGSTLPPERDLAVELEVNRATLRQAIARLEQIGLLTRRQGSGTVVGDPTRSNAPEVVARLADGDRRALLRDLLEVREALAAVIGRRAAGELTATHLAELRRCVGVVRDATGSAERQFGELAFFAVLVEAAGNRAIRAMLRWVEAVYEGIGTDAVDLSAAFAPDTPIAHELAELLDVAENDGDLETAVTAYARRTGERLLTAIT